ncbi:hypothetical protein [Parolsenella catena]|uniref:hypothetical protein n=1 Tax=Parolsenella catena TaxID=2003188 RepID=UPI002FDC977E
MFRPMRRTKRTISDENAKRLLEQGRRAVLAVNGDDGYPSASAAVFGARLGSARDNWTEQLTNTASQACPLAALLLA